MTEFTSDFFLNNRIRLADKVGADLIIVAGHGLLQKSADEGFAFRQDSSFWYLTGLDDPDLVLVVDARSGKSTILAPASSRIKDVFDGALDERGMLAISGADEIVRGREADSFLKSAVASAENIGMMFAMPGYIARFGMYTNPARARVLNKVRRLAKHAEIIDAREHMSQLRVVKQDLEIEALRKAAAVTREAFSAVGRSISEMRHEYEIEALIEYEFQKRRCGKAYESICAAGINACTLHHRKNDGPIRNGDLVLIDAGAACGYYAADVTRMFSAGTMNRRQLDVYNAVAEVHSLLLAKLKPGMIIRDFHAYTDELIAEKLHQLKLIKHADSEAVRKYFPHAVSHYLGLDVHDPGDYDKPLEPGTVLTVEPGIYIPEESIGVRIEDDVVITATGVDILTSDIPIGLQGNQ